MHMADALLSPVVGSTMWVAAAGTIYCCSKKVNSELDDKKIPLMGVLGAFIFAAQMINFTIPATGSSGHLGGGMILAILLGPWAAFLTMASVLTVQALFFADGGLLALGCNIMNLGVFPCFVAYPLIYRRIAGNNPTLGRITAGSVASAVVGLQLGSFCVVAETVLSGVSELPFAAFVLMMQPIHLAIGLVEGFVTAAVVSFIWKARPEVLSAGPDPEISKKESMRPLLVGLLLVALVVGGGLSWFASSNPDGLEWAIHKVSGQEELAAKEEGVHGVLARVQEQAAILPDYGFKSSSEAESAEPQWTPVDPGTSISGLVGGTLTLAMAAVVGLLLKRRSRVA